MIPGRRKRLRQKFAAVVTSIAAREEAKRLERGWIARLEELFNRRASDVELVAFRIVSLAFVAADPSLVAAKFGSTRDERQALRTIGELFGESHDPEAARIAGAFAARLLELSLAGFSDE